MSEYQLNAEHWWNEDGQKRVDCLVKLVESLADTQKYRKNEALGSLCMFEGQSMGDVTPGAYANAGEYRSDDYEKLHWNIPRALALTVQAKISGTMKPKVSFVVTDGDWSIKRKSKKLDRFVEGQMHMRQGRYADIWQLGQQIVLDACVFTCNSGTFKVTADFDDRKVVAERVWPWEVYYDPFEVRAGSVRTLYHRYRYDRDALLAKFDGDQDKQAAIKMAKAVSRDDLDDNADTRSVDQVWIYESWRLPRGDKPGTHITAVDSGELDVDDWKHDGFPIVQLSWIPEVCGAWGKSLVAEASPMSDEVNFTIERMREAESKLSNGACFYEEGSITEDVASSNDIGRMIAYAKGAPQPHYTAPNAWAQSTLEWMRLNYDKCFELHGVSQMGATARKEQGVTAAVAMRTINDLQTERFSVFAGAYEQLFVEVARRMIWATQDLAEEHGDIVVKWPGKEFMQELNWSDVNLPEDTYRISLAPVSGMKNTPADRLSLAEDMLGAGSISPEAYTRVVQYLDMPGEFERANRQREWVGKMIEEWLDAEQGDEYEMHGPIPFMDLEGAILQVAEEYFGALLEGVPDYNQTFFLTWMEQCNALIEEKVRKMAEAQAAANAPPQPAGGPMPAQAPPPPVAPAGPAGPLPAPQGAPPPEAIVA